LSKKNDLYTDNEFGVGDFQVFGLWTRPKGTYGFSVLVPTSPYANGLGEGQFGYDLFLEKNLGQIFSLLPFFKMRFENPDGKKPGNVIGLTSKIDYYILFGATYFYHFPDRDPWTSHEDLASQKMRMTLGKGLTIFQRWRPNFKIGFDLFGRDIGKRFELQTEITYCVRS